jgi:hypothetical protein
MQRFIDENSNPSANVGRYQMRHPEPANGTVSCDTQLQSNSVINTGKKTTSLNYDSYIYETRY